MQSCVAELVIAVSGPAVHEVIARSPHPRIRLHTPSPLPPPSPTPPPEGEDVSVSLRRTDHWRSVTCGPHTWRSRAVAERDAPLPHVARTLDGADGSGSLAQISSRTSASHLAHNVQDNSIGYREETTVQEEEMFASFSPHLPRQRASEGGRGSAVRASATQVV